MSIGIDAAVVAPHQIAVRGEVREDFRVSPTLAGLAKLTERLETYAGSLVVAEPTAGTWLPLAHAVTDAGCEIGFVANRDSARLRKAIVGASKTDVIDADMLARCQEVLGVVSAPVPPPGQIALRRAMRRRHVATIDAHRVECRLWALAAWAFPDLWRATGGHTLAQPLLRRWPHLEKLGRARLSSITEMVAAHSRDTNPGRQPNGSGRRPQDGPGSGRVVSISTRSPGKCQQCSVTSRSLIGGLSSSLCEVVVHGAVSRRQGKAMANALSACFQRWVPVPRSPPLWWPMFRMAR